MDTGHITKRMVFKYNVYDEDYRIYQHWRLQKFLKRKNNFELYVNINGILIFKLQERYLLY